MSDEIKEPMQTPETRPNSQPANNDAQEIMAMLEKMSVKTPKDLEGMATAAYQKGRLANEVGQLRSELKSRDDQIMRLVAEHNRRAQEQNDYYNAPGQNQGVNIQNLIRDTIRDYHHNEIIKPQMEARNQFQQVMARIRSDEHYDLVRDVFQAKLNDPDVQFSLNTGETNMLDLFKDTKLEYYQRFMSTIHDKFKGLAASGAVPANVKAPHMESNQTTNYVPPGTKPNTREQLASIRDKSRGSNDDIDKMLSVFFPEGDPMMKVTQRR